MTGGTPILGPPHIMHGFLARQRWCDLCWWWPLGLESFYAWMEWTVTAKGMVLYLSSSHVCKRQSKIGSWILRTLSVLGIISAKVWEAWNHLLFSCGWTTILKLNASLIFLQEHLTAACGHPGGRRLVPWQSTADGTACHGATAAMASCTRCSS